jgi:hypothetical protein
MGGSSAANCFGTLQPAVPIRIAEELLDELRLKGST